MYIGNDLQIAHPSYKIIDDISSSFNGSTTSFALNVNGATPVPFPISTQQVMISVNGVVQEPDPNGNAGFKLLGSNIVFSSAPANGHAFFGVINAGADYVTAGSEFPDGSATAPSFTFQDDQDTGWFRSGSGAVGFSANGVNTIGFDGNGLTVTGDATFTGDSSKNLFWDKSDGALEFADNAKAVFGTGSDLQIYHNGSTSYIKDNGTGSLVINSVDGNILIRVNDTEESVKCIENGAVELYHNNAKKLETSATGATITGTLVADGDITSSAKLIASSSSSGDYVRLYGSAGTGKWDIYGHGANLRFSDNESAGSVVFDTSVQNVGIGTTSPSSAHKTHIINSTYGLLKLETTLTGADGAYLELLHNSSSPADNDELGYIGFRGKNDNAEDLTFAYINAKSIDVSDGTEDGELYFRTTTGGSSGQLALTLNSAAATFAGGITTGSTDSTFAANLLVGSASTSDASVTIGASATGNRNTYIDLIGDTTYTDYGARFIRHTGGSNANSSIYHRGTGNLNFICQDAGSIILKTDDQSRLTINSTGAATFAGTITGGAATFKSAAEPQLTLQDSDSSHTGAGAETGIKFLDGAGTQQAIVGCHDSSSANLLFETNINADMGFKTNGSTRFSLGANGSATTGNSTCTGTVSDSKGNLRSIVGNPQSGAYTLVAADAGKMVTTGGNTNG
jgi:hypothetical protein